MRRSPRRLLRDEGTLPRSTEASRKRVNPFAVYCVPASSAVRSRSLQLQQPLRPRAEPIPTPALGVQPASGCVRDTLSATGGRDPEGPCLRARRRGRTSLHAGTLSTPCPRGSPREERRAEARREFDRARHLLVAR